MTPEGAPDFESELPTREQVITTLRDRGIDDPETRRVLLAYDSLERTLTDVPDDQETNNFDRFKRTIEMAKIYYEGGYKDYALESLDELSLAGLSDEMMDMVRDAIDAMV